jgi:hypothetical protein
MWVLGGLLVNGVVVEVKSLALLAPWGKSYKRMRLTLRNSASSVIYCEGDFAGNIWLTCESRETSAS